MEKLSASAMAGASVIRGLPGTHNEQANATGVYTATCIGADGQVKWSETFSNLVTTQGKNYLLQSGFAGSSYTNNSRMSLITSATPTISDTYATPGTGTVEVGSGVIANRASFTWGTASAGSISPTAAVSFAIGGSATVTGCMLVMVANTIGNLATRGDTATANAILYSSGTFIGGSKAVTNGDTLNVTYTAGL